MGSQSTCYRLLLMMPDYTILADSAQHMSMLLRGEFVPSKFFGTIGVQIWSDCDSNGTEKL